MLNGHMCEVDQATFVLGKYVPKEELQQQQ